MVRSVDMAELANSLTYFFRLYDQHYKKLLAKFNIHASAINLIHAIDDQVMTLTEITEATGLDKSTVSRQMNMLVKQDYAVKKAGKDKRFALFQLTPKAEEDYQEITQATTDYLSQSLDNWSEEEKQMLLVLIGRLNHSLSRSTES